MRRVLPSPEEKPHYVAHMFGRIAPRYDRMNRLMSLGLDGGWRAAVVRAARVRPGQRALDVGTGTGHLALALARAQPSARVLGVDFAEPMLRAGQATLRSDPSGRPVGVAVADALHLPLADRSVDVVVSAFLVRNLADVEAGLREMARVLRPGGRLVILEITPGPRNLVVRTAFRLYFRGVVPLLGRLIAGDARAYTYLPESAAAFLEPAALAALLRRIGLLNVRVTPFSLGSVAMTEGMSRLPE